MRVSTKCKEGNGGVSAKKSKRATLGLADLESFAEGVVVVSVQTNEGRELRGREKCRFSLALHNQVDSTRFPFQ